MLGPNSQHPVLAAAAAAIYLALAVACVAAARKPAPSHPLKARFAWSLLALLHLFFAADAWFGLHNTLGDAGRDWFRDEGWYAGRRPFQLLLTISCILAIALITAVAAFALRRMSRGFRRALAGAALNAIIFIMAAISLHAVDVLLAWPTSAFGIGAVSRAAGCALTAWGCRLALRPTNPVKN